MVYYILDGDLDSACIASLGVDHRFGCGFEVADLPLVSICDLAHVGNQTPATEFTFHIDGH